jgi:hypothetical protein
VGSARIDTSHRRPVVDDVLMRSLEPIPGNPWPHDMVLTISNDDQSIDELLWVRAAWGLTPRGDAPPPAAGMPEPLPSVERLRRDKREWSEAWLELWSGVLAHVGNGTDHALFDALSAAPLGSAERERLFDELTGPSWRARFGDAAFDDRFQQWERMIFDENMVESRLPLDQHPERRCLAALIPAWERGLTVIVVIPCAGDYTRTVGPNALCLTRAARRDPDRYERALASFNR